MAMLRLGVTAALLGSSGSFLERVNLLGVVVLLVGAVFGFFGDRICERFMPDQPQRAIQIRLIGLALAFAGALWTMNG